MTRHRTLPVLLLAATALSACATLPPPAPARVAKAPASYAASQALAAPARDWPADAWWTAYGDTQLDGLMAEALAGSPTLAAAEARVRKAEALAATAHARQLPTVSGNASVEEMKQSYNLGIPAQFVPQGYNAYGLLTLNFNWELDFWGKNRAAVAAAVSDTRAAQADAAEARLVLSTNVAAAYADLARLYAERDVAERAMAVQGETSKLVADRVVNGLDTLAEQRQAEAEPLQAKADLSAIDEQIALTRDRLAALAGAGPDRGLGLVRPSAAALKPLGVPAELAASLVGRRPDVTAARWRAEAAASRIHEARAAFFPDVNLAAFIGTQALHLNKVFAAGSDVGSVGPAVTLPIFEGGRLRAGLRGAEADRDAAVASYDDAVTEAFRQVADVVASSRALQSQIADSKAALAASEDAFRIATLRYKGGLATYPTVLLAEQAVLRRRRIVADLDARALALDVELVRALGGGYHAAA
ncbi:MAG TPA: efflux transporter outer membrane subunit [Phenylobacterium sp.]|jgi:NodT family efflux transporter outer membrane factor (OMF) lipoprotein|uniref:efflux transporter outer membrane subunit n=1 Tax=Phenylobacterium sp. TaxID=1871053 RepID=UPI002C5ED0EA|nr:efflux transporter outer membrane subunit [Phenylobacterium sp.]HXA38916.1 efflux transporter outer membrane subunit [Phenylobacterium sp.]